MKLIDVFYQGEGFGEIRHLEIEPDATIAVLKARLVEMHHINPDVMLYLEDKANPISEETMLADLASPKGLKIHVHRCHHISVTVSYNNDPVDHEFGPGTTVSHVKHWAAEDEFGMSKDEAGEYVLQIAGTHIRPTPGTHIGSLTDGQACNLAFDLVPDERVNGASGSVE